MTLGSTLSETFSALSTYCDALVDVDKQRKTRLEVGGEVGGGMEEERDKGYLRPVMMKVGG